MLDYIGVSYSTNSVLAYYVEPQVVLLRFLKFCCQSV